MPVAKISKIKLPNGDVYQLTDNTKAPLDSAALIGTPTAPTPAAGDSSNRIATTAFVMAMMNPIIEIIIFRNNEENLTGITATATTTLPSGETRSFMGTATTSDGSISIPVDYVGQYSISYSDVRVRGDKTVYIRTVGRTIVVARYEETVKYTVRINEKSANAGSPSCVYLDDALNITNWDTAPIFSAIRPCVLKNGVVDYYLQKNDFTKKEDGTDSGIYDNNFGINNPDSDVMIEIPKFGYRIRRERYGEESNDTYLYIEITNQDNAVDEYGSYCYDAFSRLQSGDLGKFYQGAYKGWIDNDGSIANGKLRSLPGKIPAYSKKIGEFRTVAQKRNTNSNDCHYQQATYAHLVALQCLYLIRYCDRNGQTSLGKGIVDFNGNGINDNNTASSFTFVTGYDLASVHNTGKKNGTEQPVFDSENPDITKRTTGEISTNNYIGMNWGGRVSGESHMKLFGIEDFWGNIWEWVDGLWTKEEGEDNNTYITYYSSWNTYEGNATSGESVPTSFTSISSGILASAGTKSGYIKNVVGNSQIGFMPTSFGGESTKYWADVGFLAAGSRVLFFGGGWDNGDYAGPFYLYANYAASDASRVIGGRLSYN